jgi:hypothetical protein
MVEPIAIKPLENAVSARVRKFFMGCLFLPVSGNPVDLSAARENVGDETQGYSLNRKTAGAFRAAARFACRAN